MRKLTSLPLGSKVMVKEPRTCIILAGGLGTRLRTVVTDLPKCLAPIGGRPFLAIQIAQLKQAGINDVVLSLGHLADKVIHEITQGHLGEDVRFVVENHALGTGGAIRYAMNTLGLDEVLVVNGDTYIEGDLDPMLTSLNREARELFRMALVSVNDRQRFGSVEINDTGYVGGILEKGQEGPGLINGGLYRLCSAVFDKYPTGSFSLEADLLPLLVARGCVSGYCIAGQFIDIGVPEDYMRFCDRHGISG